MIYLNCSKSYIKPTNVIIGDLIEVWCRILRYFPLAPKASHVVTHLA